MQERIGENPEPDRSEEIREVIKAMQEGRLALCKQIFETSEAREVHEKECRDCAKGARDLLAGVLGGSKNKPQG